MKQRQYGFSLIELMIVLAIFGILTALAFPSMRAYVIRAKVTGALLEVDKVKTDLSLFYSAYGRFPVDADERASFAITTASGHPTIRELAVVGGANVPCNANVGCTAVRIIVVLKRAVYFGIGGDNYSQFVLAGNGNAAGGVTTWSCGPRPDVQPFKLEWLPSTCRDSIPF